MFFVLNSQLQVFVTVSQQRTNVFGEAKVFSNNSDGNYGRILLLFFPI